MKFSLEKMKFSLENMKFSLEKIKFSLERIIFSLRIMKFSLERMKFSFKRRKNYYSSVSIVLSFEISDRIPLQLNDIFSLEKDFIIFLCQKAIYHKSETWSRKQKFYLLKKREFEVKLELKNNL